MAIKIRFDGGGNPEQPVFLLANRGGKIYGVAQVQHLNLGDYLTEPVQFNFNIYKELNGVVDPLWDEYKNFRLLYCKEWDKWFQFVIDIKESNEVIKTINATGLSEAELSQINLYNIEINTENDIIREDYEPNVLYNPSNPKESILHRVLAKAPNYSINHVDQSIMSLQRTFTFNETSIHDALNNISQEIDCMVIYENGSDENNKPKRMVSFYDLEANCSDCGYRGTFTGVCPKCNSKNITEGYGEDTNIFITADELTDNITLNTNTDAVKNCFKLEGGDDLMTATIRSCNPNGGDYLWYIADYMKEDMSDELKARLEEYDNLYESYNSGESISLNLDIINQYNALINKYKNGNVDLSPISMPLNGFSELMNIYYDVIDFKSYLENSLMPTYHLADTTAQEQVSLLTTNTMSPCAVSDLSALSLTTANNAILSKAKSIIDARYKVGITDSILTETAWSGTIFVENYSDEDDLATVELSIEINDDISTYLKQQIDAYLAKNSDANLSVSELFSKGIDDFKDEIKKYNLNSLNTFYDAIKACMSMLEERGISDKDNAPDGLYEEQYYPYFLRCQALEDEIKTREDEIEIINGLEDNIISQRNAIQKELSMEDFLGEILWNELALFRREDKYTNENYVAEGLTNAQVFARALEFIDRAKQDLEKSTTQQHSITSNLYNLLIIDKFKPLVNSFAVGNWLRVKVDDKVYKLRLIKYEINYDDLSRINIEFSDVTTSSSGITDQQSIVSKWVSMTTSYSATKRQSDKGKESYIVVKNWLSDGLDSAVLKMMNGANSQSQVWDESGMLFRRYNEDTSTYDPEQLKIINSTMVITKDNWETTSTAVGHFFYKDPATNEVVSAYGVNAEVLVGNLILGDYLGIYNSAGTMKFDDEGFMVTNGINTVCINPNDESLFTITKLSSDGSEPSETEVMSMDASGNGSFTGKLSSTEAHIGDNVNYLDFSDGVLTLTAKNIQLTDGGDSNVMLNNLANLSQADISQASIDFLTSEMVTSGSITTALLHAEQGDFDSLTAGNAFIDYLESNLVVASEIKVDDLKAKLAQIDTLEADSAFIQYLEATLVTASEIDVDDLKAKLATIDTLEANTAFARYLQSVSSTTINQVVDSSYVTNLVAGNLAVSDLQAGDIVLSNNMRILSENGSMIMNGDALQITGTYTDDEGVEHEYVGIQLGYDTSQTPSLILRNQSGATVLTPEGITSDAIADQLIINDMVKDGTLSKTKLGFEVIEPNAQGGIDITQVYDGTEQFGVSYTSFKQNTNNALDALDEKIDKSASYVLYIECPNGTNIHGATLVLNAKLLKNSVDVTDNYLASCFTWTRHSQDTEGDTRWNTRNSTGTKVLQVTANDVRLNADFQCKFEYEDITVTSN